MSSKTCTVNGLNVPGEALFSPPFAPKSGIDNYRAIL